MTEASDGFVRLPYTVIEHAPLSAHELLVYMVLLKYRDHRTGKCWPGLTTIADESRLSRRTVIRTISDLEKLGAVDVTRTRNVGEKNQPNVYTVRVFDEKHNTWWHRSAKGTRIPKRPRAGSDSQSLSREVDAQGSDSQSLGSDSESLGVVTPSHPNKNHENKIHEQALTRTLPSACEIEDRFFLDGQEDRATEPQVAYLKDLATHLSYGSQGGTPDELQLQRWRKLTRTEATAQIRGYLKALGRPDEIYYPEYGTPEYDALSDAGKEFADTAGMPDSVFDYGFKLKENKRA